MSVDVTARRGEIIALILAAIAIAIVVAWWRLAERPKREQPELASDGEPLEAAETAKPPRENIASQRRLAKPAQTSENEAEETATSTGPATSHQPSLIDQLIAIRAIGSQADVSAYLDRNAEAAAKYVDRFCEESNRLKKKSPLREVTRERDAAPFLAPRIDWETTPRRHGTLHLPEAFTEKLSQAESNWPSAITAEDLAGRDFDWMRDLHAYDHWSLLGGGPITEPNPPEDLDHALPHFPLLLQWTKLRFAYALRLGGMQQASADVRHLAHLVHSQGILLTELIALYMLKLEREAFDAAGGNIAGVEPYQLAEVDRLRKLTRYSGSFFYPGVDPRVMKKALDCAPSPCAVLFEGSWLDANVGEFAAERSDTGMNQRYSEAGCESALLGHLPKQPASVEEARKVFEGPPELENLYPDER